MATVHFIRHGDTEASGEGMFSGDLDPPLAPFGLVQANELATRLAKLPVEAIYVSPKLRARTTAEPGAFEAWHADPASKSPPGGESGFTIAARAMPVVDRIVTAQGDRDVLVFSHKATIRIIACALLGVPLALFRERIACDTASITSFSFGPKGATLVRLGHPL